MYTFDKDLESRVMGIYFRMTYFGCGENSEEDKAFIQNNKFKVSSIKIGDIHRVVSLGCHPAVIISIKNNMCYSLLLTTEENTENIIGPINSRYITVFVTGTMIKNKKDTLNITDSRC